MEIVFGDVVTGVHGDGFEYLFSWQAGGPVSFNIGGREWLYRAPRPALWRATTDNDRGNGFPVKSAMWMGADMFATASRWTSRLRRATTRMAARCRRRP